MRLHNHRLELLSPARDAGIAREAILHGADAVYIGGPGFGARHNASNSLSDIAGLVPFAHRFGAKVFVTLNTILHDDELEPAQRLITDLYDAGVDALIVQDMGIMELDLPPGNAELRHAIARRYALQGMNVSPDEIVITAGALEALNLSLQAVTEPGDWVVVENPCFYGALQALERLRLKALSVATDVREGIDLTALEAALQNYPVKACWLMTNGQNPLGFTLSAEKKAALMALLARYNVMLIEDDVYSELYFGREKPLPAKFWDRQEMTLHCSSFSKCLVPGFRIGWVAAGKQARRIQQLQLMSTLSTSSPMQLALVDYLSTKRYDAHLRRLRRQLAERKQQAWQALLRHLPPEVVVHHSDSGYFLWIELPEGADASALSARALASHISIAPGKMFSTSDSWTSFFRFNTAWGWGEREEQGVKRLGELIREQLA